MADKFEDKVGELKERCISLAGVSLEDIGKVAFLMTHFLMIPSRGEFNQKATHAANWSMQAYKLIDTSSPLLVGE
jgi:hypothetical protein